VISIIIPTLNEVERLPRLVAGLQRQSPRCEIIIADGCSRDGTVAVARSLGVKVLRSAPGRGQQIACGANMAAGDVLLLLHADSVFPDGGLAQIEERLAEMPEIVGGNFRLLFDGHDAFSRRLTRFYAWMRGRGLYYGDSAVFVRRHIYQALGGLRPVALMEDYDFTRRLERYGPTCCIEDPPVITSSRRFQGRHPLAIIWGWLRIHALYHLGVSPDRLSRLYDSERRRTASTKGLTS
jgi:rSAM/selenodomain-associated transferase 2